MSDIAISTLTGLTYMLALHKYLGTSYQRKSRSSNNIINNICLHQMISNLFVICYDSYKFVTNKNQDFCSKDKHR